VIEASAEEEKELARLAET